MVVGSASQRAVNGRLQGAYLQGLRAFMNLASFRVEFHCVREGELDILRKS